MNRRDFSSKKKDAGRNRQMVSNTMKAPPTRDNKNKTDRVMPRETEDNC